jgi:hypothetical protein
MLEGPPADDPDFEGHGHCFPCPEGADCRERGLTLETLPLKPAFWRSGQDSYEIEPCTVEDACSQTNATDGDVTKQCARGHEGKGGVPRELCVGPL